MAAGVQTLDVYPITNYVIMTKDRQPEKVGVPPSRPRFLALVPLYDVPFLRTSGTHCECACWNSLCYARFTSGF